MKVLVDTSALVALLDEDDPMHREAAGALAALRHRAELVTHNYVLVEAVTLVRRRLGAAAEARLIDSILPLVETIWIDEATHRAGIASYRSGDRSGSLVDHVSFSVMQRADIEFAFAFDADFERRGFLRPPEPTQERVERRPSASPAPYISDSVPFGDLVSVAEIATRSGRPTNTVQSWRRRHHDFPEPVAQLAAGPVWSWPAVGRWIEARSLARRARASVQTGSQVTAG